MLEAGRFVHLSSEGALEQRIKHFEVLGRQSCILGQARRACCSIPHLKLVTNSGFHVEMNPPELI